MLIFPAATGYVALVLVNKHRSSMTGPGNSTEQLGHRHYEKGRGC